MAVQRVDKLGARRAKGDSKFVREYEVPLQVICDGPTDPVTIGNHPDMPGRFEQLAEDPAARCIDLDLRETDKSGRRWEGSAHYSTNYMAEDQQEENPLSRAVKWSGNTDRYTEPITEDLDGQKVLNSAGQPFQDTIERDSSHTLFIGEANLSFNPESIAPYVVDHLNATQFRGYPAAQVKCDRMSWSDEQVQAGISYWTARAEFTWDYRGWNRKVADLGFHALVGGKLIKVAGDNPRFLKKVGNDAKFARIEDGPQYLNFRQYPTTNFQAFGFQ